MCGPVLYTFFPQVIPGLKCLDTTAPDKHWILVLEPNYNPTAAHAIAWTRQIWPVSGWCLRCHGAYEHPCGTISKVPFGYINCMSKIFLNLLCSWNNKHLSWVYAFSFYFLHKKHLKTLLLSNWFGQSVFHSWKKESSQSSKSVSRSVSISVNDSAVFLPCVKHT